MPCDLVPHFQVLHSPVLHFQRTLWLVGRSLHQELANYTTVVATVTATAVAAAAAAAASSSF